MKAILSLDEWLKLYRQIASEFGYEEEADQRAADLLSELLGSDVLSPQKVERQIRGKPALVFGAGPSIDEDLDEVIREGLLDCCIPVAADGATSALLGRGVMPTIVVTDLDGRLNAICEAKELGSMMVVHAHGDNIEALAKVVPKLRPALGTTQVVPRRNVYNFGGFTDGDRAVFLAVAMEASLVALAGMNLSEEPSKYEREQEPLLKHKKFLWGKRLLELLARCVDIPLFNLTARGREIAGFRRVSARGLRGEL